MRIYLFLITVFFFLVPVLAAGPSASESLLLHYDTGTYNQRYYDMRYLTNNRSTFGMRQSTFGMEYTHADDQRNSTGGGFAYTEIEKGRLWNYNHYETHSYTLVMVPYVFAGYGFTYFGCELGISCYLQLVREDARLYYLEDGSTTADQKAGIRLDRRHSHAFVNGKVRLFRENSLHCRITMGRENFDPVNSLISVSVVYPFNRHRFEYYLTFLTIDNYFYTVFDQDNVLKANQTTGISYSCDFGGISLGARAGFLIYNGNGGDGIVPVTRRLNCGVFTILKW